jgi:hypothetical protein
MLDALENVVVGFKVGVYRCVIVEGPFKIINGNALIVKKEV